MGKTVVSQLEPVPNCYVLSHREANVPVNLPSMLYTKIASENGCILQINFLSDTLFIKTKTQTGNIDIDTVDVIVSSVINEGWFQLLNVRLWQ